MESSRSQPAAVFRETDDRDRITSPSGNPVELIHHGGTEIESLVEYFRMLMDGVTDYAIILIDSGGNIVDWNIGAQRVFGYSKPEVLGGPAEVIFTSEDRELHIPEAEMKTALALGRADDERWHLRKDGTRFIASGVLTATKLQDGRPRGFVKIIRDVTQRQTAEKLLQRTGTSGHSSCSSRSASWPVIPGR